MQTSHKVFLGILVIVALMLVFSFGRSSKSLDNDLFDDELISNLELQAAPGFTVLEMTQVMSLAVKLHMEYKIDADLKYSAADSIIELHCPESILTNYEAQNMINVSPIAHKIRRVIKKPNNNDWPLNEPPMNKNKGEQK